mmetsp:Transcript_25458/g.55079  ORF Transcript_25458/g.55079 Transcript_25458/m.55079 type:complete len:346 (+) Transcript_25458:758-1795(+)
MWGADGGSGGRECAAGEVCVCGGLCGQPVASLPVQRGACRVRELPPQLCGHGELSRSTEYDEPVPGVHNVRRQFYIPQRPVCYQDPISAADNTGTERDSQLHPSDRKCFHLYSGHCVLRSISQEYSPDFCAHPEQRIYGYTHPGAVYSHYRRPKSRNQLRCVLLRGGSVGPHNAPRYSPCNQAVSYHCLLSLDHPPHNLYRCCAVRVEQQTRVRLRDAARLHPPRHNRRNSYPTPCRLRLGQSYHRRHHGCFHPPLLLSVHPHHPRLFNRLLPHPSSHNRLLCGDLGGQRLHPHQPAFHPEELQIPRQNAHPPGCPLLPHWLAAVYLRQCLGSGSHRGAKLCRLF